MTRFKIHIQLLSLANFKRSIKKKIQYTAALFLFAFCHLLNRLYKQGVTGKNGCVAVPLFMNRLLCPSGWRLVHNIIMQQRKVVEHLNGKGDRYCILEVAVKHFIAYQQKYGANSFAAQRKHITH